MARERESAVVAAGVNVGAADAEMDGGMVAMPVAVAMPVSVMVGVAGTAMECAGVMISFTSSVRGASCSGRRPN